MANMTDRPDAPETTISQTVVAQPSSHAHNEDNLFYAYAQQTDDPSSRYLLTFAHAGIALDWYERLRRDFSDLSRPNSQLFAFDTPDLLAQAWRHESVQGFKGLWMYTRLGEVEASGPGGHVIPVQDVQGNIVGGNIREERDGARGVTDQETEARLQRLEKCFDRMVQVVERTTERLVSVDTSRKALSHSQDGSSIGEMMSSNEGSGIGKAAVTSASLDQINDLLRKNAEYILGLTKKHQENEQRLRKVMEMATQQQQSQCAPAMDLSPIAIGLENVEGAVEKNSSLLQAILDQRTDVTLAEAGVSSEGERESDAKSSTINGVVTIGARLDAIRDQGEKNNELMQDLISAVHEGNGELDFSPVANLLESVRNATQRNSEHLQAFLHNKADPRNGTPNSPSYSDSDVDSPDIDRLDLTPSQPRQQDPVGSSDIRAFFHDLRSHLSRLQTVVKENAHQMHDLQTLLASNPEASSPMFDTLQVQSLRETANVMREAAQCFRVQSRVPCGHVILPPPRKMERKVVGYVYEVKPGKGTVQD